MKTIKQLSAQIKRNLAAEIKLDNELRYKKEFSFLSNTDIKKVKTLNDNQEKIFNELRSLTGFNGNTDDKREAAIELLENAGLDNDSIIGCLIALNYEV